MQTSPVTEVETRCSVPHTEVNNCNFQRAEKLTAGCGNRLVAAKRSQDVDRLFKFLLWRRHGDGASH